MSCVESESEMEARAIRKQGRLLSEGKSVYLCALCAFCTESVYVSNSKRNETVTTEHETGVESYIENTRDGELRAQLYTQSRPKGNAHYAHRAICVVPLQ